MIMPWPVAAFAIMPRRLLAAGAASTWPFEAMSACRLS
jgi:hypothetical protein